MRFIKLSIVLIVILLIGYFVLNSQEADACALVDNQSFQSIEEFTVAMGPNGPVTSPYFVNFKDNKFYWLEGEVGGGEGTYTCDDSKIVGNLDLGNTQIFGEYTPDTNSLLWNNIVYKKNN